LGRGRVWEEEEFGKRKSLGRGRVWEEEECGWRKSLDRGRRTGGERRSIHQVKVHKA
jgi:hypothetical protein